MILKCAFADTGKGSSIEIQQLSTKQEYIGPKKHIRSGSTLNKYNKFFPNGSHNKKIDKYHSENKGRIWKLVCGQIWHLQVIAC